jgi:hypothetical protein
MSSIRVWLFRGLVAIAAGLMVTSVIMPWWSADVRPETQLVSPFTIEVYQYGIPRDLSTTNYLSADITPFYQTMLAWFYLAASVGLIIFSTWLRGRKGRWLLGSIGIAYIAYAAIAAFVVIANRVADFGVPLQGHANLYFDEAFVNIDTRLLFGYYLAYASGLMCIALALLRNLITGKPKPNA